MVTHRFVCDDCRVCVEDTDTKIVHLCGKCGQEMRWDIKLGCLDGDYTHISDSLAISPDQIAEHRAHFPDVNVLPDGRIEFDSVRQHSNYIDKCGFCKHSPKLKPKSERLKVS